MLQNPHRSQPRAPRHLQDLATEPIGAKKLAQHRPSSRVSAKKLAQHRPSSSVSAKKLAQHAINRRFWGVLSVQGELFRTHAHHQATQGELFRARTHTRPSRATNVAHEAWQHGDIETNNTTAHHNPPGRRTPHSNSAHNPTRRTQNDYTTPQDLTVGRAPGRAGSHPSAGATYSAKLRIIDQFSSNPSWLGIVRRRVSASARARSWLSCLMSVEGGVAVGDQVQGCGLLGEIEGVLVAHV